MFEEFAIHNQFKESLIRYSKHDPHLKKINALPIIYHSSLLTEPNFHNPGIYVITGGRQVGKTTFLKQFILHLLAEKKIDPFQILFLTGELIDTHHILRRMIEQFHHPHSFQYLFIDEVNYIQDWDKAIKFLADSGMFDFMSVILTGSDSQIIRTAMKRLAGRRGGSDRVDFIFNPLSFYEFVSMKAPPLRPICKKIIDTPLQADIVEYPEKHGELTAYFYEYLLHGGYLPAITDYALHKTISKAVVNTYMQWIVGDILKHNKSENYLYEILRGIKSTSTSQISWNNLARYLSIEHHKTVADYCFLLESIHVLHIVEALIEHKLTGAPKKNRKLYFRDPFIHHAVSNYVDPTTSFVEIEKALKRPEFSSSFVETVAVDHCKRWSTTFYIKGAKGEIDIALIQNKRFYPIEVKWRESFRAEDLKQIKQYKNGIILTPKAQSRVIGSTLALPLVRFLIHISPGQFQF
jgi:predicted AAA+ superfamily ATPase